MPADALAYFCPRVNLLKLYGPVIAEQVRRREFRPLVVVPQAPLISYAAKNRNLASALRLPQLESELGSGVEIACVDSAASFLDVVSRRGVRAVVGVGLRLPPDIRDGVLRPSRARGVRWCSLGYLHEELFHVLADGVDILADWDLPTTFSQSGIDLLRERLVAHGADPAPTAKFRAVGFVECDQAADFDRAVLRQKYGLPRDRPVIFLATAPPFESLRADRGMRWLFSQSWYRGHVAAAGAGHLWRSRWPTMDRLTGYREIVAVLRRFADRHGALLLGKTRDKHDDPRYLRRSVDRLLTDGAYHPFRTLELLYLADLYIGMYSSTAFEAAFLGRRLRTVAPFPPEALEHPRFLELKDDFFFGARGAPGIWNAPGLATLDRTYTNTGWEALRDWADYGPLETQIDPAVKSIVVRRALGFDDFKASQRFLDAVESALEGSVR